LLIFDSGLHNHPHSLILLMEVWHLILAAVAAIFAGFVNAIAGGGTLITFPVLTALGMPAVMANVTNTVALCPGYFGGTLAQLKDLRGQQSRLWLLVPASILGGVAGGLLLLYTGEKNFRQLVPYLILLASILLALQGVIRKWINSRSRHHPGKQYAGLMLILVFPAAIYGGYFGAGASVIILAVLGLVIDDSIVRMNALKQAMAFCINVSAAIYFLFSGQVNWIFALIMAAGAILGGILGGKLAGSIRPALLRWLVVAIGFIVAIIYFIK
jgi:uncharacterized protein